MNMETPLDFDEVSDVDTLHESLTGEDPSRAVSPPSGSPQTGPPVDPAAPEGQIEYRKLLERIPAVT